MSVTASILQSGFEIAEREAQRLEAEGKRVAVMTVWNPSGVRVKGTAAFDTKAGKWELSGELEKLKNHKSLNWQVEATWSR
jgi:hypothetical protein